jgi:hypothetical protein
MEVFRENVVSFSTESQPNWKVLARKRKRNKEPAEFDFWLLNKKKEFPERPV